MTLFGQGAKIIIQIVSLVVLARIISPSDFGLVAMVVAVIGVADIFRDFGLSSAVIQAPSVSRDEQINLFWVNTALGVTLALLALASAPLVAALYRQPGLTPITMILAANFVVNGMATQYRADLNRRMRFRQLAVADVSGPALGLAAAISLALSGAGVWALVTQQIVQVSVTFVLVVVGAGWLPGLYRRAVSVRRFLTFGLRLAGSQIVGYIGSNVDTVALGLTVTPFQLGVYNRSYQLIMTPLGQIRGPLNSVAIPVLARLQDDEDRFQSYIARGQMAMGYTLVAGLAVVSGLAGPLAAVILGPQWTDAVPVLRLLAIGAGFNTLAYVGYWVYVTKGLVQHLLHYTIFATGLRVAFVVAGAFFGVIGVAAGMAVVPLLSWPISFWWLSRRAAIPVRTLWLGGLRVIGFAAAVGGVAALAVGLSSAWPSWGSLLLAMASAALAYGVLGSVIPPFRRDLASVFALVKDGLRRGEPT